MKQEQNEPGEMPEKGHFCQNHEKFCVRNDAAPEAFSESSAKRIPSGIDTFLRFLVFRRLRKMARWCLEKFCVRVISLLCSFRWLYWLFSSKQAKNLFVRKAT